VRRVAHQSSDAERSEEAAITDEDLRENQSWARRFLSVLSQAMLAAKEEVL
jgi:hypothetical protein